MDALRHDLRYALRLLRRTPGSSLVAILTLALGIAGTTLVFAMVSAVLLAPLPYPEPDRLVQIWQQDPARPADLGRVTPPNLADWRAQTRTFADLAYFPDFVNANASNLAGRDGHERVATMFVSANFFRTFGTLPRLGRTFRDEEDRPGAAAPTAIVSAAFWRRHFDSDPAALGRTITLDTFWKRDYTVVGIMPDGFTAPGDTEIWLPIGQGEVGIGGSAERGRCCPWLQVIGRLKPGVTIEEAQREMDTIADGIARAWPETNFGRAVKVVPLHEQAVGGVRRALLTLFGAAGCVLLIACVNLAHLALARAAGRRAEMGLRTVLGAGRGALVRQLAVESLLLSLTGGLIGAALAAGGLRIVPTLLEAEMPRADTIHLTLGVLAFSAALAIVTGLLVGVAPAWRTSAIQPQDAVRQANRSHTPSPGHRRLHGALVVAEMAMGLILVAGALLLAHSLLRLLRVDPGFRSDHLLVLDLDMTSTAFEPRWSPQQVFARIRERLRGRPGVLAVSGTLDAPLARQAAGAGTAITVEGEPFRADAESRRADRTAVMPDYFDTMGIAVKAGRAFTEDDRADRPEVAIINESMAAQCWPALRTNLQAVVGKRFSTLSREGLARLRERTGADTPPDWTEVVGIVADTHDRALDRPPRPTFYHAYGQSPWHTAQLVVRTTRHAPTSLESIRADVRDVNRNVVIARVRTMDEILSASLRRPRLGAGVASMFAGLGLLLAALGLYGVMAHGVAERTREFGVRVALGARPADLLRLVLGRGAVLTLVGLLVGLGGVALLTNTLRGLLYAISPLDPVTLCAASAALAAVALASAAIPARRAALLDPVVALRQE